MGHSLNKDWPKGNGELWATLAVALLVSVPLGTVVAQEPSSKDATINGRVVDANRDPIPGANVSINFRPPAGSTNQGGLVWGSGVVRDTALTKLRVTSGDGTFEARGLQPGQHLLLANAPGYLGSDPVTVTLTAGQQLRDVTLQLPPEASIGGVVLDDRDEPLVGAEIQVLRRAVVSGRIAWRDWASWHRTDDRGVFRIGGLRDGEYLVLVRERKGSWSSTYFPGSVTSEAAQAITLRTGENRAGVNFSVRSDLVGTAVVAGRVVGGPQPLPPLTVHLESVSSSSSSQPDRNVDVAPNGTFVFRSVPRGTYQLRTWSFPDNPGLVLVTRRNYVPPEGRGRALSSPSTAVTWVGDVAVSVGDSTNDVVLPLSPAARVLGKVTVDPAATGFRRDLLTRVAVVFWPVDRSLGPIPAGSIEADGRFTSVGLPAGKYHLWLGTALVPGLTDWYAAAFGAGRPTVATVEVGLKDVTVEVVITNRLTELSGTVFANGRPQPGAIVLVFNANSDLWSEVTPRRFVANNSGQFSAQRLRAGDYYAVAVPRTPELWQTPDYLNTLVRFAVPFSIEVGGSRVLDLKLSAP